MKKCISENCDYFNEYGKCSSACVNNGIMKNFTNYDRIRNMGVEELAKFIDTVERCKGKVFYNCDDRECYECAGCVDDTLQWLEAEVTE